MQELTFTLTIQEANLILAGLQEMPAKVANPLTEKLRQQAKDQIQESDPNSQVE